MSTTTAPTPPEQRRDVFLNDFRNVIAEKMQSLKRDGTVAMGRDNLFQLIACDISRCRFAPQGTNCAFVVRQYFNELCDRAPGLRKFTTI